MKYAKFYFKGGLIITGLAENVKVVYSPYIKNHPVSIEITPLESVWTGNMHFTTHAKITFNLWDLISVVLVENYLSTEGKVKTYLTVKENPKNYKIYWLSVAKKVEKLWSEKRP